jgi:DNA-binding transcriptional LysR family regulator
VLTPSFSETTALVAVLEQKSFTKAAAQLGLSPGRVSELVRSLEDRLRVRLVERTTRSVAPTRAGEQLLERLRPLLDGYQEALESVENFRAQPAGLLRLTVAPAAADFILAPVIGEFISQYPEINLDISINRSFVDIVDARFDAGIRNSERVERDMIAVKVSEDIHRMMAASPNYVKRFGAPTTPDDLRQHACLQFRFPSGAVGAWRFFKGRRNIEVPVSGPLTATEPGLLVRAAVDGAGIVALPHPYLAPEIEAGRLVRVLADWEQPQIGAFFLYYSSRRQMRPPLKAFVAFLRRAGRVPTQRPPVSAKAPRKVT